MKVAYQQGNADGLCGIYALLNFLQQSDDWPDGTQDTLWYLLDAVRHFGWLNPHTLVHGFEAHQLKDVLDLQIKNYFLPLETFHLPDIVRSVKHKSARDLFEKITGRGGSIITGPRTKAHWFLVTGSSENMVVLDSSDVGKSVCDFADKNRVDIDGYGVVILPREVGPIQVNL